MAIRLLLDQLSDNNRSKIINEFRIKPTSSQYGEPEPVNCFATSTKTNSIFLPMGRWKDFCSTFPTNEFTKVDLVSTKKMFTTATDPKGYRDQDRVVGDALTKLKNDRAVFIACSPGFGKTSMAAYLACQLKVKVAVLCHIDTVNEQWVEEFSKFTNAKVQRVKGKKLDAKSNVYVMGVMKASKMTRDDFKDIGLVILDEAHIATITAFTVSLLKFTPAYLIGLSATPKRADGMHKLIHLYFGPESNFISREEKKEFEVYKVETPYKPKINYVFTYGRPTLDWVGLVNSLAYNEERQNYIVSLVLLHPERRILILSDRQKECESIYEKLTSRELVAKESSVLLLTGATTTKKKIDTTKYRVLVAGLKKAGVGFNDPSLTMLILATDMKDVVQREGRIRTNNNIIYDLVDDYSTLENHWKQRESWYQYRGATIKTINLRGTVSLPPSHRFLKSTMVDFKK